MNRARDAELEFVAKCVCGGVCANLQLAVSSEGSTKEEEAKVVPQAGSSPCLCSP